LEVLPILNYVINGLLLGGVFALTALGMSIIAGIMRVINLAHGDVAVLAAYLALIVSNFLKVDPLLSLVVVAPLLYVLGYFIQRFLVNKLIFERFYFTALMTFSLSIILQNLMLLLFTADARSLITPYLLTNIDFFGLTPPPRFLIGFAFSFAAFIILYVFLKKTYIGKVIRAVPADIEGAKMLGIKSEDIYCIAAGLAYLSLAIAGVLLGMAFVFFPDSGPTYLLLSFGILVLGGWGSIRGTFVGGLIFGLAMSFGGLFFGSRFQLVFCYLIILIVLIIKPRGIFGGKI
jgi:branched-chain amino acid transport system permease protein